MIELYHCADARSFRCLWLLEELQLPYRLHMLGFPPRIKAPDFLQRHSIGTVPLLIDGDVTMFESAAILQYLVTRHGPTPLAVAPDEGAYADFLNWMHFGEASLATPLAVMLRYALLLPEPQRLPQVVADYRALVMERFDLLAARLQGQPYACSGRFTAADISLGYAMMLCRLLGLTDQLPASLQDYWTGLQQRAAFKAARAAQKPSATA